MKVRYVAVICVVLTAIMVFPNTGIMFHTGEGFTHNIINKVSYINGGQRAWAMNVAWELDLNISIIDFERAQMDNTMGDDFIFASTNSIEIYTNSGGMNFAYWKTLHLNVTYNLSEIDVGDFDSDGNNDICVFYTHITEESSSDTLYMGIFFNDGNGNFTYEDKIYDFPRVWYSGNPSVDVVDIDRINGGDILIALSCNEYSFGGPDSDNPETVKFYYLRNTGDGRNFTKTLVFENSSSHASGYLKGIVKHGYANPDNYPEVAIAIYGLDAVFTPNIPRYPGRFYIFKNTAGSIVDTPIYSYQFGGHFIYDFLWANADGDPYGYNDIVLAMDYKNGTDGIWNDGLLYLIPNLGNFQFGAPTYIYQYDDLGGIRHVFAGKYDTKEGLDLLITFQWTRDSEEGFTIYILSGNNDGTYDFYWHASTDDIMPPPLIYADSYNIDSDSYGTYDLVYCGWSHATILQNYYIDDEAPPAITGVSVYDTPNDEGGSLTIQWAPSTATDFDHYCIYIEKNPFSDVSLLTPEYTIADKSKSIYKITTCHGQPLQNNVVYYVAITAVDSDGNENKMVTSYTAIPRDNLPPPKITGLKAFDTPDDNGGSITVEWDKSTAPDFDHYNVYIKYSTPFESLVPYNPEMEIKNIDTTSVEITTVNLHPLITGGEYYVAVTAVDTSGNEDEENFATLADPVIPLDNIAPGVIDIVRFEDVPGDSGGVLELEWETAWDIEDFDHYNVYISNKNFTTLNDMGVVLYASIDNVNEKTLQITSYKQSDLQNGVRYYATVTAVDTSGNEINTGFNVVSAVPMDNIPPEIIEDIVVEDKRSDDNGYVILTWSYSLAEDFDHYNIYVSQFPVSDVSVLTVEKVVYGRMNNTAEINTVGGLPLENNKNYTFYVTAVDTSGNERTWGLNYAIGGPQDDIPPEPLDYVRARDVENDKGRAIFVEWSKSKDENFKAYRIYISTKDITTLDNLEPVVEIDSVDVTSTTLRIYGIGKELENNREYYVAVTVIDLYGLEDTHNFAKYGPVVPKNNIPPAITTYTPTASVINMEIGESTEFTVYVVSNSYQIPVFKWYLDGEIKYLDSGTESTYELRAGGLSPGRHNLTVVVETDCDIPSQRTWVIDIAEKKIPENKTAVGVDLTPYILAVVILIMVVVIAAIVYRRKRRHLGHEHTITEKYEAEKKAKTEDKAEGGRNIPSSGGSILPPGTKHPVLPPGQEHHIASGRRALPPTPTIKSARSGGGMAPRLKDTLPPPKVVRKKVKGGDKGAVLGGSVKDYLPPRAGQEPSEVGLFTATTKTRGHGGERPEKCPVCGKPVLHGAKRCDYCGEKFE